jgi:hypothetical protein
MSLMILGNSAGLLIFVSAVLNAWAIRSLLTPALVNRPTSATPCWTFMLTAFMAGARRTMASIVSLIGMPSC